MAGSPQLNPARVQSDRRISANVLSADASYRRDVVRVLDSKVGQFKRTDHEMFERLPHIPFRVVPSSICCQRIGNSSQVNCWATGLYFIAFSVGSAIGSSIDRAAAAARKLG
jgi:hypothetical protein